MVGGKKQVLYIYEISRYKVILFKKMLMACCDGCQKKAKIMEEENMEIDQDDMEALDVENAFECNDQNKDAVHEVTIVSVKNSPICNLKNNRTSEND